MNRRACFCLAGAIGLVGCTASKEPIAKSQPAAEAVSHDGTVATYVNLKVPNMH